MSVKDISGGKIDFSESKKVSKKTFDNASYGSKPKKGDILFGRFGTIGKPQIISEDIPFCIFVSLGFLRDHLNILNKEYICSWMNSYLFEEQVKLKATFSEQKDGNAEFEWSINMTQGSGYSVDPPKGAETTVKCGSPASGDNGIVTARVGNVFVSKPIKVTE